jgi:hypothetical protein
MGVFSRFDRRKGMLGYMKNWWLTKKFLVALAFVFSLMTVVLNLHEKKILVAELNKKGPRSCAVPFRDLCRAHVKQQLWLPGKLCGGHFQRR